jgi:Protein of unknown function (DUF3892)
VSERHVTQVARDSHGRTTALGNPASDWSPVEAEDAIAQIRNGVHRYFTGDPEEPRWLTVVQGSASSFLRSDPDTEKRNNLDNLPSMTGGTSATGGYDLVLQMSEAFVRRALTAMHATGSARHTDVRIADGQLATLSLGPHEPTLMDKDDPAAARVRVPLSVEVRPLNDSFGDRISTVGSVDAHVLISGDPGAGGQASVVTDWSATKLRDVQLSGATGRALTTARTAVLDWARADGGGRFMVPQIPGLGSPSTIEPAFGMDADGDVWLQLAVDFDQPVSRPLPTPRSAPGADWALSLSRHLITHHVLYGIAAKLGGAPPPPIGSGQPQVAPGVTLKSLTADLDNTGLTLTGSLSSAVGGATFTAKVPLHLNASGGITSDPPTVTVTNQDLLVAAADFFTGGAVQNAIRDGVRDAFGGSSSRASFLTADFLGEVAAIGQLRKVAIHPHAQNLIVSPTGITIEGTAATDANPAPHAALDALVDGSRVLLLAGKSWAPGQFIVSATFDFGDGSGATEYSDDNLVLSAARDVAPGNYTAKLTVEASDGRQSTDTRAYHVH